MLKRTEGKLDLGNCVIDVTFCDLDAEYDLWAQSYTGTDDDMPDAWLQYQEKYNLYDYKHKAWEDTMKNYQVIYKFSDVIMNFDAEDEDDAQRQADAYLAGEHKDYKGCSPDQDTECYDTEIEEDEDEN